MNRPKTRTAPWRTATFRLAMVFALIFGLGGAGLLLVLDFSLGRYAQAELEDTLRSQMAIMRADANLEGGAALIEVLTEHHSSADPSPYDYLVITPSGESFTTGLPKDVMSISGFGMISLPSATARAGTSGEMMDVLVLTERLGDGSFLAVGRETAPVTELREGLHQVALLGGLGLVVMAGIAGLVTGSLFTRRLEHVTRAAEAVMSGKMGERLPSIGFGREFDVLAATLNRMLDRLEQAMNTVRQVSADLAHDLRTPLTRLRNTLEDAARVPEAQRAALISDAIRETDEVLSVFASLLRLAQIEGGEPRGYLKPVDLAKVATAVVDAYRPTAEDSGHTLEAELPDDAIVQGDAAMLQQALSNLLENALMHTPTGATVRVGLEQDTEGTQLIVADDGPGVPDHELENIQKRFYRLDHSRTTPGAGLGLTLVRAIAELHGASMSLTDNRPGLRIQLAFQPAAPATSV